MAGQVGKVGFRAEYDGSGLSRGLKRSKVDLEEFAKNAKRAFQFGAGEAGIAVLRGGFDAATSALKAMRGDTEAAWDLIKRLPFGLGAAIASARDFWKELSGENAETAAREAGDRAGKAYADAFAAARSGAAKAAEAARRIGMGGGELKIAEAGAAGREAKAAAKERYDALVAQRDEFFRAQLARFPNGRSVADRRMWGRIQTDWFAAQDADLKAYQKELADIDRVANDKMMGVVSDHWNKTGNTLLAGFRKIGSSLAAQWNKGVSDLRRNVFIQDAMSGARRTWEKRFGGDDDIAAGERAGQDAVEAVREQAKRERDERHDAFMRAAEEGVRGQKVLDDINRENRIMRTRAKKGELAADLQAIHEEYEAKRQALRDENAELNADAIKALQVGERMALAERRKIAASSRRSLVDISGQSLMLGGPNPADSSRFLKPMLNVLATMNRRDGRQDFAVRQWAPAFGGN